MFRKLLSNLPFTPSLIQEVSFYAKRLHREEGLRRTGLVLVALALFVQMFAAIRPAEASSTGSGNDILYGGFSTQSEAVRKCEQNSQNFKTILAHYQLSCGSLAGAQFRTITSRDAGGNLDSMGRWDYGNYIKGNPTNPYTVGIGGTTYHMKNLWSWDSAGASRYNVLAMRNPQGVEIMVMYDCGNIVTNGRYSPPTPSKPVPKPAVADIELAACDVKTRKNHFLGWAWDGDRPTSSLTVTLYIDNAKVGTYQTNKTRSEINKFLKTTGTHGFDINLTNHPSSNDGKKHTARVTFPDVDSAGRPTGKTISSANKSFGPCTKVPPPPPPVDVCPGPLYPGNQTDTDECKPCDDSTTPEDAAACLEFEKTGRNDTQNVADANNTTANGGDVITYTLTVKNTGKLKVEDYIIEENLGDVMEYAEKVVSADGGKMDDNKIMRWDPIDIAPGATITKKITIQIKNPVPQTPQSTSNPGSFDLMMCNTFHDDTICIKLPGSTAKIVEQTVTTLPNTGPGETVAMASVVMVVASYFFARSRLTAKELDLVREDFASSGGV